jgi:hypothetical protein
MERLLWHNILLCEIYVYEVKGVSYYYLET